MDDRLDRIKALCEILLDRGASVAERDDAAIDLGEFDDSTALVALMAVAVDSEENDTVLSSCGESIALIWLRTGKFDLEQFKKLIGPAQAEARAVIKADRPEWLEKEGQQGL